MTLNGEDLLLDWKKVDFISLWGRKYVHLKMNALVKHRFKRCDKKKTTFGLEKYH